MINFPVPPGRRILCLGAHSDDIEIGCGASMLKLLAGCDGLEVLWVVLSADGKRKDEARESAASYLSRAARYEVSVQDFRTSFFPYQGEQIKEFFETLKAFKPDIVFTHYREDRHQDHRVVSDLTWNTFRDHLILEYEIPKYDGDLGKPNVFVQIPVDIVKTKVTELCRHFQTQSNKHWFSEDTFSGLMRLRGVECASPSGYAEAFHCRKLLLG